MSSKFYHSVFLFNIATVLYFHLLGSRDRLILSRVPVEAQSYNKIRYCSRQEYTLFRLLDNSI